MSTDKIVNKSILIHAPISRVWDCITHPEIIKEWLWGTTVISDWKVGSPILFTGNWQGTDYADKGTILKFDREKVFEYNYWSGFSGLPDKPENYSLLTFELSKEANATNLQLLQRNFATETMYEHSDKNWEETIGLIKSIAER